MVVLDQRRVAETHPVVYSTTDPHRVLLQYPKSRQCLASVADLGLRARDRSNPGGGRRRDARKVAHQVQHGSLGGQQSLRRRHDGQQHSAGIQPCAVFDPMLHQVALGSEYRIEHQKCDVHARDHAGFAGDQRRGRRRVSGHRRQRGHVRPVPQVFFECAGDDSASLRQLVSRQLHQQHTAADTRLRASAGSVSG